MRIRSSLDDVSWYHLIYVNPTYAMIWNCTSSPLQKSGEIGWWRVRLWFNSRGVCVCVTYHSRNFCIDSLFIYKLRFCLVSLNDEKGEGKKGKGAFCNIFGSLILRWTRSNLYHFTFPSWRQICISKKNTCFHPNQLVNCWCSSWPLSTNMYHGRMKEIGLLYLKGGTLFLYLIFIGSTAIQTTEWAAWSLENIRYYICNFLSLGRGILFCFGRRG